MCIRDRFSVEHVALAKQADVVMIAPASANSIAKLAHGLADDMLTTTVLACRCRKIIAPAMNTNMYENPIVQDNIKICEKYGDVYKRQRLYRALKKLRIELKSEMS